MSLVGGVAGDENNFRWEVDGSDIIELETTHGTVSARNVFDSRQGGKAYINARSEGTAVVSVSHPKIFTPTEILVKVLPASAQLTDPLYITGEDIIGIVVGQQKNTSAFLSGSNVTASDAASISWSSGNSGVVGVSASGGSAVLSASSVGETYITVTHPNAEVAKKILVYTAATEEDLATRKIIYTTKNYFVIHEGANAHLRIYGNNFSASDISGITWQSVDSGIASLSYGADNADCIVSGVSVGVTTVTAAHALCALPVTFEITVVPAGTIIAVDPATGEEVEAVNTNYISGVSIIGIVTGQTKNASVILGGKKIISSDSANLVWNTESSSIVTVSGAGADAVLQAHSAGQTYVTVTHPKVDVPKRILVYTANSEAALEAVKLLYTVKNNYTIVKGSSDTLYLNYNNIAASELSGITWTVQNGSIAQKTIGRNNSECIIKGTNIGSTTVTAAHGALGIAVTFNIEVVASSAVIGAIAEAPIYFTTAQNVVQFTSLNTNKEVTITPVNLPAAEYHLIDYTAEDTGICTIVPNGNKLTITAKAEGETVVRVSHSRAENVLKLTVRVGDEFMHNNAQVVYISTASEVVTIVKGSTDRLIEAALVNSTEPSGFTFSIDRPAVASITSQFSGGRVFVRAQDAGQAELTIRHAGAAFDKKIIIIVGNTQEEIDGIKYLSTAQNVVTVPEGGNKTVSVSVQGSSDVVVAGYTWSSSDSAVVNVNSIGASAQLIGNGVGSAIVTVRQTNCPYPLEIIVMVIDPVAAAAHPYITTAQSIYLLTVGQNWKNIDAELIGGAASDADDFAWNTPNGSILNLYGQGKSAMVKATAAGNAVITISHPKAQYTRTIRIICEAAVTTNCYISVPESIITMKPTDGAKSITASLINGVTEDRYNFQWFCDTYDVVELNYSANVASIRPLQQGQTTLHITHPKSAYEQLVIIKVTEYTTFSFGKTSQTITEGAVVFISMQVPSTSVPTHVEYSTNAASVVTISGTKAVSQLTGAGEGTAIVKAKLIASNTNSVQAQAEMLVYCQPAASSLTYISTSQTVFTVEKTSSRNISADIAGSGVIATDRNSLHWTSSDPSVVKISGASTTGTAVGQQINVQAVGAGECTITITHEKSNSPLTLYFIVPGSNQMGITLNKTYVVLETGKNTEVKASLSNAQSSDYNSIVWTLDQTDGVTLGTLLGSGQTVALYATRAGNTKIRATLPNGQYAECDVRIQAARLFQFASQSVRVQPGESKTVSATVTPSDVDITFVTTSDNYFIYSWNGAAKIVTITGIAEGTASLSGVTNYGNKGQLNVTCAWDYEFNLGKSVIAAEPRVDAGVPDKFVIPYTVNPASAVIEVNLTNDTIATYVVDTANKKIILTPTGEGTGSVVVSAKNPDAGNNVFATKTCALNFKYNRVTLVSSITSKQGSFSNYSSALNLLTIGDGETVNLGISVAEPNVNYQIESVTFQKHDASSPIQILSTGNDNIWQVKHPTDVIVNEYLVTHDSWFTVLGQRIAMNFSTFHIYTKYNYVPVPGGYLLVYPFVSVEPFISVNLNNYPTLNGYPVRVLTDIPDRRVSISAFKANKDWYIPSYYYYDDRSGTVRDGMSPEYFINPAGLVPVLDSSVVSSVASGSVRITILRNGAREVYSITVQTETRNCVYNR